MGSDCDAAYVAACCSSYVEVAEAEAPVPLFCLAEAADGGGGGSFFDMLAFVKRQTGTRCASYVVVLADCEEQKRYARKLQSKPDRRKDATVRR